MGAVGGDVERLAVAGAVDRGVRGDPRGDPGGAADVIDLPARALGEEENRDRVGSSFPFGNGR